MNTFIWPRQSADCPVLMDTVSPPPHHISLHNKHGCQNQTKWNQFILYSECMLNEINVLWGSVAVKVVYFFWIHDDFRRYGLLWDRTRNGRVWKSVNENTSSVFGYSIFVHPVCEILKEKVQQKVFLWWDMRFSILKNVYINVYIFYNFEWT